MNLRRVVLIAGLGVGLGGCDQLFPELTGADNPKDLAAGFDGNIGGTITGKVCRLVDLRAPATCSGQAANVVVTIAESRATAATDASGNFTISLANVGSTATFELSSKNGGDDFMPTITVASASTLLASRSSGLLLPAVDAQNFGAVQLANGVSNDPARGAVIGWVVSPSGAAVASAVAAHVSAATGPLYDVGDGAMLEVGATTGAYGTVAFLDVQPGTLSLGVSPPAGSALGADTFSLPVIGGCVTVEALALPGA